MGRHKKTKSIQTTQAPTAKFSAGYSFGAKQAKIFGQELMRIQAESNGELTPKQVVNSAKNPKSPLHDWFEWDNDKASELYRLTQARTLINQIDIEIKYDGNNKKRQRAFVNVMKMGDNGAFDKSDKVYVSLETALTNDDYRRQTLTKALAEIAYWKEKYESYEELSDIFKAIRRTRHMLGEKEVKE
jgi:hypothetical protein